MGIGPLSSHCLAVAGLRTRPGNGRMYGHFTATEKNIFSTGILHLRKNKSESLCVTVPIKTGSVWVRRAQGGKREFRLLVSEEERPTAEYDLKKALDAPVKAGEYAGAVYYRLGKKLIGQSRYRTEEEAAAWDLAYCMEKLFHFWLFLKL